MTTLTTKRLRKARANPGTSMHVSNQQLDQSHAQCVSVGHKILTTDCSEADHATQLFAHILRPSCPFIRDNKVQKMIDNIFVSLSKNIRCTTACYVTPHHSSHFQKKGTKEGSKLVPVRKVRHALNACGNDSSLS